MGTKKDKHELRKMLSPQKEKFLGLKSPPLDELMAALQKIDWKTEKRVFVDVGDAYAYNPNTDFWRRRDAFYSASVEEAPTVLAGLVTDAMASGVPLDEAMKWARCQRDRWFKERQWDSLNG